MTICYPLRSEEVRPSTGGLACLVSKSGLCALERLFEIGLLFLVFFRIEDRPRPQTFCQSLSVALRREVWTIRLSKKGDGGCVNFLCWLVSSV
jgi:hypothetical protein